MMKLIHNLSKEIMDLQQRIIRSKASPKQLQLGMEMNEKNRLLIRKIARLANSEISEKRFQLNILNFITATNFLRR